MNVVEFCCRSGECDGRLFSGDARTAKCIHCGSNQIRRTDRPIFKRTLGITMLLGVAGLVVWYCALLDDAGREKIRHVQFMACADTTACNYAAVALIASEGKCKFADLDRDCEGNCWHDQDGDGICDAQEVLGCTDPVACNYNVNATEEDHSCGYPEPGYTCLGACIEDTDGDGICDAKEVFGCTDPEACNFAATATESDGTCWYRDPGKSCDDSAGASMYEVNCDLDADGVLEEVRVSFKELSSDDVLEFELRTYPSTEHSKAILSQVGLRFQESESQSAYPPCEGISHPLLEPFCDEGVWFLAVDPYDSSLNVVLRSSSANGRGGGMSVYRIRVLQGRTTCTREIRAESELDLSGNLFRSLTIYDYEEGAMEGLVTTGNVHDDAELVDMIVDNDQWSGEAPTITPSTVLAVDGITER